jgi:hypothetical protein
MTKPHKNHSVNNPQTGTPSFGVFPEINFRGTKFEAGHIYLRYGKHIGPNRGFGVDHIWAEHFQGILTVEDALREVSEYVSSILQHGGAIHSEFEMKIRCMVFKSKKGLVILEPKLDGQNNTYYSVVTAFNGQAKGPRIGAL